MISIVLVAANPLLRQVSEEYLNAQWGLKVIAVAKDGLAGVELASNYQPNVVVTDLMLPKLHGLEVVRQINDINPRIKIIVFSLYDDPAYYQQCIKNGAAHCISKAEPLDSLIWAIRGKSVSQ
jgi:DNA-binding NarL/FixJ family response regulator